MHTIQTLSYLVENNQIVAYLFIFLITIFEGEIMAIFAGSLVLLGALNFWICLLAIFCGGLVKTLLGYALGEYLSKKFKQHRFFQYIEKKVLTVMPHFEKKPFWSIFLSKFLMVNHVVIIFSGYKKIDFKTYLQAEVISTLLWAVSLLSLGYFFSYTALSISKKFNEFILIIVLFIVGLFLLEKIISFLYDIVENFLHEHK